MAPSDAHSSSMNSLSERALLWVSSHVAYTSVTVPSSASRRCLPIGLDLSASFACNPRLNAVHRSGSWSNHVRSLSERDGLHPVVEGGRLRQAVSRPPSIDEYTGPVPPVSDRHTLVWYERAPNAGYTIRSEKGGGTGVRYGWHRANGYSLVSRLGHVWVILPVISGCAQTAIYRSLPTRRSARTVGPRSSDRTQLKRTNHPSHETANVFGQAITSVITMAGGTDHGDVRSGRLRLRSTG